MPSPWKGQGSAEWRRQISTDFGLLQIKSPTNAALHIHGAGQSVSPKKPKRLYLMRVLCKKSGKVTQEVQDMQEEGQEEGTQQGKKPSKKKASNDGKKPPKQGKKAFKKLEGPWLASSSDTTCPTSSPSATLVP